jgi:hypothetical protein
MSATLEAIRTELGTNVPTKPEGQVYLMYGYSISNGLKSFTSELTAGEKATYWDSTSTTIRRLQNNTLGSDGDGHTYLFPYLKKENNTYYDPTDVPNQRYGTGTVAFTKLQALRSDTDVLFVHDYSINGTAFMLEAGVDNWNINAAAGDSIYTTVKNEFTYVKKYVGGLGYTVNVKGLIMAIAVADVWNVTSDGYTKAQFKIDASAFFSGIRTHVEDSVLPIYWYRPSAVDDPDRPVITEGQDEMAIIDNNLEIFDITAYMTFPDTIHPNGDTAIDGWEELAILINATE